MLYFVLSGLKETKTGAIGPVATKHKKDLSKISIMFVFFFYRFNCKTICNIASIKFTESTGNHFVKQ